MRLQKYQYVGCGGCKSCQQFKITKSPRGGGVETRTYRDRASELFVAIEAQICRKIRELTDLRGQLALDLTIVQVQLAS